jgi:hypothetical protein
MRLLVACCLCASFSTAGCGGTLDAGRNRPRGPLPVDERNPVILVNDSPRDNWYGEYAMLLANDGGPRIAGIVVCGSNYWPDTIANANGWTALVDAARASGLESIPDVTPSWGEPLAVPGDRRIESTVPNHSAGAQRIIELSREFSSPSRPVVVLVGTELTDVADAFLVDRSVADRVVVVAALGSLDGAGARMTGPNGDLDPWADWIVAHSFQYVQVSAYYDQTDDVTAAKVGSLPENPLGQWMAAKRPDLATIPQASDQITVLASIEPGFAAAVQRVSPDPNAVFGSPTGQGPPLVPDDDGRSFVVTKVAAPLAPSRLWQMLL